MTSNVKLLFDELSKSLADRGEEFVKDIKGMVVFKIDDQSWTLDLREGSGSLYEGTPEGKPDLTLTISSPNFVQLVYGKLSPQTAFLLRKLQITGSMGLALKMQPVLDAAKPKSKL